MSASDSLRCESSLETKERFLLLSNEMKELLRLWRRRSSDGTANVVMLVSP